MPQQNTDIYSIPKIKTSSFSNACLVIVVTVLFFRSKNQDDLDKKTSNHLPLPLDYASNEGECPRSFKRG